MRGLRRLIIGATIAAGIAVLLYFVPLFHIVPLNQAGPHAANATFDPVSFVDKFWTERLIPAASKAVDAAQLVAAVQQDPEAARQAHGHSVGLGSTYCYLVSGTGRVVSLEKDSVRLSLLVGKRQVQVLLQTGNIFGNVVRDGTGLLNVNSFANSQDFNALSAEINRRIEQQVLPQLRKRAVVGVSIHFVGCTEITEEDSDLQPLRVVPLLVEVQAP
jgi:predicted lipoprotein